MFHRFPRPFMAFVFCFHALGGRLEAFPAPDVCEAGSKAGTPVRASVLEDYVRQTEARPLVFQQLESGRSEGVERRRYLMTSQAWSQEGRFTPDTWRHQVDIHIPDEAVGHRALLIANNGVNHGSDAVPVRASTDFPEAARDEIARKTRTIVVSISDVPNQLLKFGKDGRPLLEDHLVARSWALFLDDPDAGSNYPVRLPMVAALSRAMTLAQLELKPWRIDRFTVTGASKRGWAAWLSALGDRRVEGVVPIAIDLMNTQAALTHIHRTYGGNWPIAFHPYCAEGIDRRINTPEFSRLMEIEDPVKYLGTSYASRLGVPEYIINASGDDFFVPDNSRFYLDRLPGAKALRMVPNSDHRGAGSVAEQSLISYLNRIQRGANLPAVSASLTRQGGAQILNVHVSEAPERVTLWTAENPVARDFRHACGIRFTPKQLVTTAARTLDVPLLQPSAGWQAAFVEAVFSDGFVATTPTYITPDDRYPDGAPPSNGARCATLPGRGLSHSQ